MFEKFKIIGEIKKLKNVSVNDEFLRSLRNRLKADIAANPAKKTVGSAPLIPFRARAAFASFMVAVVVIFSGGSAAMASQDSLPGEFLYPVKLLTEEIRLTAAVSAEKKAELYVRFAGERIVETNRIIAGKGNGDGDLDIAILRFEEYASRAADIVKSEKAKGKDVGDLARKIDNEFENKKQSLGDVLATREREVEKTERGIEAAINEAGGTRDAVKLEELARRLEAAKAQREALAFKRSVAEETIEKKIEPLEMEIGPRAAAEKALRAAERKLAEAAEKANRLGATRPTGAALRPFEENINEARNAMNAGDWQKAREFAKTAKEDAKRAKNALESAGDSGKEERPNQNLKPQNDINGGERPKPNLRPQTLPLPPKPIEDEMNEVERRLKEMGIPELE